MEAEQQTPPLSRTSPEVLKMMNPDKTVHVVGIKLDQNTTRNPEGSEIEFLSIYNCHIFFSVI